MAGLLKTLYTATSSNPALMQLKGGRGGDAGIMRKGMREKDEDEEEEEAKGKEEEAMLEY